MVKSGIIEGTGAGVGTGMNAGVVVGVATGAGLEVGIGAGVTVNTGDSNAAGSGVGDALRDRAGLIVEGDLAPGIAEETEVEMGVAVRRGVGGGGGEAK